MKAMVSSWLFSPSRPAPPQMAKMEMTKVAMTIHSVGARALTFFLIVFSMISPQTYTRDSRRIPGLGPFQQLPGDDEPLDLRGSFVDRKDAGVPVGQKAAGREECSYVGYHELECLELGDFLAESFPLLGVADGQLEGLLGETDSLGGNPDAASGKPGEGDGRTPALIPEPGLDRYPAVFESDHGGRSRMESHLFFDLGYPEPGTYRFHDESAELRCSGLGSRLGDDDQGVGFTPGGHPGLGAVQNVIIARPHRLGLQAG